MLCPKRVTETAFVEILWDFKFKHIVISARRPDTVVLDKKDRQLTIIDIALPSDTNWKDEEAKNIVMYQD